MQAIALPAFAWEDGEVRVREAYSDDANHFVVYMEGYSAKHDLWSFLHENGGVFWGNLHDRVLQELPIKTARITSYGFSAPSYESTFSVVYFEASGARRLEVVFGIDTVDRQHVLKARCDGAVVCFKHRQDMVGTLTNDIRDGELKLVRPKLPTTVVMGFKLSSSGTTRWIMIERNMKYTGDKFTQWTEALRAKIITSGSNGQQERVEYMDVKSLVYGKYLPRILLANGDAIEIAPPAYPQLQQNYYVRHGKGPVEIEQLLLNYEVLAAAGYTDADFSSSSGAISLCKYLTDRAPLKLGSNGSSYAIRRAMSP